MSDDLLKSLGRALAEEHDGRTVAPNATRARVLAELRDKKQKRGWHLLWFPALAVFLGSSAWAMGGGSWPSFWASEDAPEAPAPALEAPRAPRLNASGRASGEEPAAPAAEEAFAAEEPLADEEEARAVPEETPAAAPRVGEGVPAKEGSPLAASSLVPLAPPPVVASRVAQKPAPPPARDADASSRAGDDRNLALYRSAHEAQFKSGDCAAAERGYAAYLTAAPQGTFALEARYNRGVCLARLGQVEAAREALGPFRAGAYGDYRRHEAAQLLEALTGAKE